jgi:hypothetical protein
MVLSHYVSGKDLDMLHDHNRSLMCVVPDIHNETGEITKDHIPCNHFQGMRSRFGEKSIDERGNFVDPETKIRIGDVGRKVGPTVDNEILTTTLEFTTTLFPCSTEWKDE